MYVASGPNPGNRHFVGHDVEPDRGHVAPVGSLADDWDDDLFQLQPPSQPRAAECRNAEVRINYAEINKN